MSKFVLILNKNCSSDLSEYKSVDVRFRQELSPIMPVAFSEEQYDRLEVFFDRVLPELTDSKDISISVKINEKEINELDFSIIDTGKKLVIQLNSYISKKIFFNCMGLATISLKIKNNYLNKEKEFFSELISVFVKQGPEKKNITSITDYVFNHSPFISNTQFSGELFTDEPGNKAESNFNDISYLKKLIDIYTRNIQYFSANSLHSISTVSSIEPFEKITSISSETIAYISSHPEELLPAKSNTGIKFRNNYYVPKHTLVKKKIKISENYENIVILSFIGMLSREFDNIFSPLKSINHYDTKTIKKIGDYEFAATRQLSSIENASAISNKLLHLKNKLNRIYNIYRLILSDVNEIPIKGTPKSTFFFQKIIAYRQIYELILDYFNRRKQGLSAQEFIINLIEKDQWYEYYTLLKICETMESCGYKLVGKDSIKWWKETEYFKKSFENVYFFSYGDTSISLFYQPVIKEYLTKYSNLELYRSSKWYMYSDYYSKNNLEFSSRKLDVYTPDFIIKYTYKSGNSGYLILDSKYSSTENVIRNELVKLLFKYIASISCVKKHDEKFGLVMLCGKYSSEHCRFHNVPNPVSEEISKYIDLIELREYNMENSEIDKLKEILLQLRSK